jgi:hypothetical protein
MLIFSGNIAAGAQAQINLPYYPQILIVSSKDLGINVNALGNGVTFDVQDEALLEVLGQYTYKKASETLPTYNLANGLFGNQNTVITLTNATAAAINGVTVFAYSVNKGTKFIQTSQQRVFANSGITVEKFVYLGIKEVVGSTFNAVFQDGTTQNFSFKELQLFNMQNTNTIAEDALIIDNSANVFRSLNFIPPSDTNIFIVNM